MASSGAVWGIDIGNVSLKALRCVASGDGQSVVAEAFDLIEYPKILSQAEPEERHKLIDEALGQFLSRNSVRGDKVAMSVSGQSGLARFFKPPPVDAKMIPDIVKYEARQQIPFPLEEVIWDFQQMGGTEVDGFTLDAEVGLFAMKREQVFRSIQPFLDAGVELDIVQLSPVAIYNVVAFDVLLNAPPPEEADPDNPSESLVVLSMGTDTTDLVITNGSRLWQRSIPLGGNHFTKQLTKELKLTYAKAEHLKRNARQAEDPKAIFQAMRPVFNDLVTEIQRSLSFFQSIDRQAKLGRMVLLGNAVKLPGLKQYLGKNMGQEFVELEEYARLTGPAVVSSTSFKDNALSFSVCYGLCLQGLGEAKLKTNLLPREFLTERMIRDKKPWAVASVGALLLAFSFNFFFHYSSWSGVRDERKDKDTTWAQVKNELKSEDTRSQNFIKADTEQMAHLNHVKAIGDELVGNADRKIAWLEVLAAISAALPRDKRTIGIIPDPKEVPFIDREDLQIEHIESEHFPDLKLWFADEVKRRYLEDQARDKGLAIPTDPVVDPLAAPGATPAVPATPGAPAVVPGAPSIPGAPALPGSPAATPGVPSPALPATPGSPANPATPGQPGAPATVGPTGAGWVVEIRGYHFHNSGTSNSGGNYVRNTLMKNLKNGSVVLPTRSGVPEEFTMKELGIDYVILALDTRIDEKFAIANPEAFETGSDSEGSGTPGTPGAPGIPGSGPGASGSSKKKEKEDPTNPRFFPAPRHSFAVQFVWQEIPLTKRLETRRLIKEKLVELTPAVPAVPGSPLPGVAVPGTPAPVGTAPAAPSPPASIPAAPTRPVPAPGVPASTIPAPAPVAPKGGT